jgi:hypothetical protein
MLTTFSACFGSIACRAESVMRVSKRFDAGVSKPHQESALRIALGAKKLIDW